MVQTDPLPFLKWFMLVQICTFVSWCLSWRANAAPEIFGSGAKATSEIFGSGAKATPEIFGSDAKATQIGLSRIWTQD